MWALCVCAAMAVQSSWSPTPCPPRPLFPLSAPCLPRAVSPQPLLLAVRRRPRRSCAERHAGRDTGTGSGRLGGSLSASQSVLRCQRHDRGCTDDFAIQSFGVGRPATAAMQAIHRAAALSQKPRPAAPRHARRQARRAHSRAPTQSSADPLQARVDAVDKTLGGASIYLVGMMGSGKTTVGTELAKMLGAWRGRVDGINRCPSTCVWCLCDAHTHADRQTAGQAGGQTSR